MVWITIGGMLFEPETSSTRRSSERQELDRSRGLYAREAFDAVENLIDDCDSSLRRPHPQEQSHRQRLGRLETEIDADKTRERAQEQARSHQQHNRKSHLRDDERTSDPMMTEIGCPSSGSLAKRTLRIDLACWYGRNQTKHQRRCDRRPEREEEGDGVQADRLGRD